MFDAIIKEAQEKFNLGDKAGGLLASLLGLIANPANGGFGGFINRFHTAGLGDLVDSWVTTAGNTPISNEQLESALGEDTLNAVAEQSGVDKATAVSALGFMTPHVVDALTPDGEVPDEAGLISKIAGFLKDYGGAIGAAILGGLGTAGALASDAADSTLDAGKAVIGKGAEVVGDAAGATLDAGTKAVSAVGDAAGAVGDKFSGAMSSVGDALDGDGDSDSILKWLIPLLILGLLVVLGYWFCGTSTPTTTVTKSNSTANKSNSNAKTTAKTVDSSFRIEAKDGKYIVSGVVPDQKTSDEIKAKLTAELDEGIDFSGLKVDVNAKPFAIGWWDDFGKLLPSLKGWKDGTLAFGGTAITTAVGLPAAALEQIKSLFSGWTLPASISGDAAETDRKLTEVSLPDGTKLQAYPGGIEDQLIKFIQSDEYKNGTAESLKAKWFNFDDLNFKSDSTELSPESQRQVDNIVKILKAFPEVKIKIGGYTDKKGDDAYNMKLSDRRAKAIKALLEKEGVGAQVPEAEGYGEKESKVAETASDEERKADRKTSVRLIR